MSLDLENLHKLAQDKNSDVREKVADAFGKAFYRVPDKAQAQQDLHKLAQDDDNYVRERVADAFGKAFPEVPDKAQAQQDLHKLVLDEDSNVRAIVAGAISKAFSQIPDKAQAWQDLIKLTRDEDINVAEIAAGAMSKAISQMPNKAQAWQDLIRFFVGKRAAEVLGKAFSQIPDKAQAWEDLIKLTQDKGSNNVRWRAGEALIQAFSQVPNKAQAWQDLHRLTGDEDSNMRAIAARAMSRMFSQIPDKAQAWQDLVKLTQDKDSNVRESAGEALIQAFSQVPNKAQAWQDLHRLTGDEDSNMRAIAAVAMSTAFSQIPDKAQAWQDLVKLTQDEDSYVRERAASALPQAFSQVPDKAKAWRNLIKLTQNKYIGVRWRAAEALSKAFPQVPNKALAWQDLHKLTRRRDRDVRWRATESLGKIFSQVPDKAQAQQDLHKLAQDKDSYVRRRTAEALGKAFSEMPDKAQAQQDLHGLTQDNDNIVRMYAYHSLGRASVFMATEAKDDITLRGKLEAAVGYFEKSSHEKDYSPASFCLPFYRTYYAITFQVASDDGVQKYLAEAREAIGSSESKDELFKAVDNLARALQKSQHLKDRPLAEIASELNAYRWFCEKAAEHMRLAEDNAPGTVKLMRMCNPLLEERIQSPIAEIQKTARQICQTTQGSGAESAALGAEINMAAQALSSQDLVNIKNCSSRIGSLLKNFCRNFSNEEKAPICEVIKEIEHAVEFPEKLNKIELALSYMLPYLKDQHNPLADIVILTVLPEEYKSVCNKITAIHPPPDMGSTPDLYAWQFGDVHCPKYSGIYKAAVGMIGRAGNTESALAVNEAIQLWRPRYVIFLGVAGGLPNPEKMHLGPKLGDVVIADAIYGYEYGKIDKTFTPRGNWVYRTDKGLLNGASAYNVLANWRERIKIKPPAECNPEVIIGEVASGEKVVDDPTDDFFHQVIVRWPKIKAVEMEGAGVGSAIEQSQSLGIPVGFMMIRGISDLPRPGDNKGTDERDKWKLYASDTAAAFIAGWIANGLPLRPSARKSANMGLNENQDSESRSVIRITTAMGGGVTIGGNATGNIIFTGDPGTKK